MSKHPPCILSVPPFAGYAVAPPRQLAESKPFPISVNYARNRGWGLQDGLREAVQNFRDGVAQVAARLVPGARFADVETVHERSVNGNHRFTFYVNRGDAVEGQRWAAAAYKVAELDWKDGREVRLTNFGIILDASILTLGVSCKDGSADMAGRFGEGMKVGFAAIAAAGHGAKMITNGQTWSFMFRMAKTKASVQEESDDDSSDEEAFQAPRAKPPARNDDTEMYIKKIESRKPTEETTIVLISKYAPKASVVSSGGALAFDMSAFLFLASQKDELRSERGAVLLGPEHAGKIFVKGIFVCKASSAGFSTHFGYDFEGIALGADRKSLMAPGDLPMAAASVWAPLLPGSAAKLFGVLDVRVATGAAEHAAAREKAIGRNERNLEMALMQNARIAAALRKHVEALHEGVTLVDAAAPEADLKFVASRYKRVVYVSGGLTRTIKPLDVAAARLAEIKAAASAPPCDLTEAQALRVKTLAALAESRYNIRRDELAFVDIPDFPVVAHAVGKYFVQRAALGDVQSAHAVTRRNCGSADCSCDIVLILKSIGENGAAAMDSERFMERDRAAVRAVLEKLRAADAPAPIAQAATPANVTSAPAHAAPSASDASDNDLDDDAMDDDSSDESESTLEAKVARAVSFLQRALDANRT